MHTFRKAQPNDLPQIWKIIQYAISRRKEEGSEQWQDGYPNPEVLRNDIDNGVGFVLVDADTITGYCAVMINDEPAYAVIEGKWLTNGDFVVFHRVARSEEHTSELQSLMRISYAVFCLKKKNNNKTT